MVAITSRGIPNACFEVGATFYIQAFLPFGNLSYLFDKKTKNSKPIYQYRDEVKKNNEASVSTKPFLNSAYAGISAVIHSNVDCATTLSELGVDFKILHNPLAKNKIPIGSLPWCTHKSVSICNDKIEIETIDRIKHSK